MLDKTIPYYSVLMIKDDTKNYPRYNLPEGYTFCMYEDGFEKYWAEVETSVDEFKSVEAALEYFQKEFLSQKEKLPERCIFVKDESQRVIATTSVWDGYDFGKIATPRIHWVSVHPDHQGKGIAKALLTKAMDVYNSLGFAGKIYLTTQTWSYKAINIYLHFGFKPYKGPAPEKWKSQRPDFEEENEKAWEIIFSKIRDRQEG